MSIENKIKDFFLGFKNSTIDEKDIISNEINTINSFFEEIKNEEYTSSIEKNILTIYGYTFRLNDLNQRLYYTFSEAVNAINMDNLMKNEEGVKLNSYVYLYVIKLIINEIQNDNVDEELILKAKKTYQEMENNKAKENKYHVYQY